ncbi:MAG: hypothetical protein GY711_02565 [bacterium]|nr:hypothetical protein [bacterium]
MQTRSFALLLVGAALAASAGLLCPNRAPAEPTLIAEARFDYRDDHGPGRIVAEVRVRLERTADGRAILRVVPSAAGPLVDPIPGYRGVRGSNHCTALELGRLANADAIELVTRPLGDAEHAPVDVAAPVGTRTARVEERRRMPGGRIAHGVLGAPRVVALDLATGALDTGAWTSSVVVRGRTRLEVEFTFDGENGSIDAVRGVADQLERSQ